MRLPSSVKALPYSVSHISRPLVPFHIFLPFKQKRQCVYNVTYRRVHETIFALKKQYVISVCVCVFCECVRVLSSASACGCMGAGVCLRACSFTNTACNEQPYCHLQPLWLYRIFPHYLTNGTIFRKKLQNIKCVF